MKVLIGSPCGGGQVTVNYFLSMIKSVQACQKQKDLIQEDIIRQIPNFDVKNPQHIQTLDQNLAKHAIDLGIYTLSGESLLQRGRNHIAQVCLTGGWDKLMFIDADAGWEWQDLHKIITSPHPVIAGICPLKTYPISMNYLPFAEDEVHFDRAQRSVASTNKMIEHYKTPIIKVAFVGTAFLCIDRKVLQKLSETVDHYIYPNPHTGQTESHWDFFKVHSISDTYLSEDWSFCDQARKAGFDVNIDASVRITHVGNHTFVAQ